MYVLPYLGLLTKQKGLKYDLEKANFLNNRLKERFVSKDILRVLIIHVYIVKYAGSTYNG